MSAMRFPVSVIFQRTALANRWSSERWEPIAVIPPAVVPPVAARPFGGSASPDAPVAPAPVKIGEDASTTRWRFDGHAFELHPSECEGYWLNLVAPEPKAFVMWRLAEDGSDPPVFPVIVTVSYNQAARMLDGGERVDAVPLPDGILAWMQPFVTEHYKPEPKKRVRRNDPFADGAFRREPGSGR